MSEWSLEASAFHSTLFLSLQRRASKSLQRIMTRLMSTYMCTRGITSLTNSISTLTPSSLCLSIFVPRSLFLSLSVLFLVSVSLSYSLSLCPSLLLPFSLPLSPYPSLPVSFSSFLHVYLPCWIGKRSRTCLINGLDALLLDEFQSRVYASVKQFEDKFLREEKKRTRKDTNECKMDRFRGQSKWL